MFGRSLRVCIAFGLILGSGQRGDDCRDLLHHNSDAALLIGERHQCHFSQGVPLELLQPRGAEIDPVSRSSMVSSSRRKLSFVMCSPVGRQEGPSLPCGRTRARGMRPHPRSVGKDGPGLRSYWFDGNGVRLPLLRRVPHGARHRRPQLAARGGCASSLCGTPRHR